MGKGTLYWITGLSGAGKTTIGNRLYYKMKYQNKNVVILDGDILKKIAGKDLGYKREERLERAYRYSALCKLLTDQSVDVIICTIAMFDEVRDWNRQNIENYVEIFLDVGFDILKARDKKGLYSKKDSDTAGLDVEIEYPKTPDIIIENDGKRELEEGVQKILDHQVIPRMRWNRDERYWDSYYMGKDVKSGSMVDPSLFAQSVLSKYMQAGKDLIELGCGNGRDSIYFAKHGLNVTGIDASNIAIKWLHDTVDLDNCTFICDDFVNAEAIYQIQYDYCYSRFTLHAINEQQETQIFLKAYNMLKDKGYFFIEARSIHDGKYGLGKNVEKNAFIYDGHYRRYIDMAELEQKLKSVGFTLVEKKESDRFAPKKGEHSVCIRVIAQKV